ncbi:tetratricopeptide repeat protein [Vibrio sp. T187]|uniref:TPR domain-containing protein n=1 Tax=Vibrio TaxID=662 RepID=UPI0010C9C457|nr:MULTISPECIES: tetratricopeptide repeat protein [Vibrio]MBW3694794.1 tetratricopeptide repeat protein [Vibrio sp. T187]
MPVWIWLSLVAMSSFVLALVYAATNKGKARRQSLVYCVVVISVSVMAFSNLKQPSPQVSSSSQQAQTPKQFMDELQQSLREDPNQGDVWFQLGNVYLAKGEFQAALTSFDYSMRLAKSVSANQYAAKATALYYLQSQTISSNVETLLNDALILDPNNETALMLIASDHFISFRYQLAIDAWTKILDSNRQGIDRVSVIHSINRAKQML